jgi:hypothetical protein
MADSTLQIRPVVGVLGAQIPGTDIAETSSLPQSRRFG